MGTVRYAVVAVTNLPLPASPPQVKISLELVVMAVTEGQPRLLVLESSDGFSLPAGELDIGGDRTLELGMRRIMTEQTDLPLGYVEQLYTFGDLHRSPPTNPTQKRSKSLPAEPVRQIGVAYLGLTTEQTPPLPTRWIDLYRTLPWEDHRHGQPSLLDETIRPALADWAGSDRQRQQRTQITFGLAGVPWDEVKTLDRYELLYEIGLISESHRFSTTQLSPREQDGQCDRLGQAMVSDHRRLTATALGRLRGKITYRPVIFEMLPAEFTLSQLQQVTEALAGRKLRAQNFRRLIATARLVEATGGYRSTRGRPAALFRFRSEVLLERPQVGV